ncbi:MAG: M60 family metallopeptidase [Phycisphaerales bacterium]
MTYPGTRSPLRWSAAGLLASIIVAAPAASNGIAGDARTDARTNARSDVPVPRLIDGVTSIATGGNPASVVVWGDARALSVRDDGTVLAAASTLGDGRVAVLGHGGFLTDTRGDTPRFIAGLAHWLSGRGPDGPGGDRQVATDNRLINVAGLDGVVRAAFRAQGIGARIIEGGPQDLDLDAVDVVAGSPQAWERAGRLGELTDWVRAGGGLLVTETAWGQLQLGRAASVEALAANRLLASAGIMLTADAESAGARGTYPVGPAGNPHLNAANAGVALGVLAGRIDGDATFSATIARDALSLVPQDSALMAAARRLRQDRADDLAGAWRGMAREPLRPADHPLAIALMDLDGRLAANRSATDPDAVAAHPSAGAFPGPIDPDFAAAAAASGPTDIRIDPGRPGWRSTGLYARPGETVAVRFNGTLGQVAAASGAGMHVQIGVWRDPQNFPERVRMSPAISRAPITSAITRIASPIGGPILIDIPAAFHSGVRGGGDLTVTISGAVPMPHYVHGATDLDAWRDEIRHRGVPWAELESDKLVFTLPADAIRDLDRPDLVMDHWDRVHAAMQTVEPRSPRHWPDAQYRYVADRKLSWGWMYCPADGPIVIPEVTARAMVDAANFDAAGDHKVWGHYHEMGHAHQNPMWTFGGTGEVTVNIFTVVALHRVNGYPLDHPATRSDPATAWRTFRDHRAAGSPFDVWRRKPFLALQTYSMLWHAFGLEAFERCFRAYDDLAPADRPRNDADKRDRFLIEMSRAVERDLGPYFEAWGVPVSAAAREVVREAGWEAWMPVEASG